MLFFFLLLSLPHSVLYQVLKNKNGKGCEPLYGIVCLVMFTFHDSFLNFLVPLQPKSVMIG